MEKNEQLDMMFYALSDSTRRDMLSRLSKQENTIKGLAHSYNMSLVASRKHLKVLEKTGLVKISKEGRVNHCRFDGKNLDLALVEIQKYKKFWSNQFDELAQYLEKNEDK